MNVASRVDSYLTNMKLPWEKDLPPVIVSVGAVECYLQENPNEYKFDRVWTKTFPCQVDFYIEFFIKKLNFRSFQHIGINLHVLFL